MTHQHPDIANPTACHICGFRAEGIGLGLVGRDKDPQWVCAPCSLLVEDIRKVKRMDAYELKAREGGMDAAGPLVEEFGSDLAQWEEEQVLMFVGTVWKGCAERLRELIRNGGAPF